jgi:choline-sulfatase
MIGAAGHPVVRTPNLDRLASEGTLFRNAYCGSPVCCPSRASMFTGMYPSDVGSYCNSTAFNGRVPTFGNRLRDAGYRCVATGKMDLAPGRDLGFEERGTAHGNFEEPDITSLFRRPVCFRTGQMTQIRGGERKSPHEDLERLDRALKFLKDEARERGPWLLYVGLEQPKSWGSGALPEFLDWYPESSIPLPEMPENHLEQMHPVFQVLRNFQLLTATLSASRIRRARAAYYARVSEADAYIGELRKHAGDTIFIYTSDHGEMLGEHGLWHKNTLLEAAARVPLIIAGPGIAKGRIVDTPCTHNDLVATLLELGGASQPAGIRGHSLLNGRHPGYAISECHSHGNYTGSFMVRRDDWKYMYFTDDEPLLFDLRNDPGEFVNRATDRGCRDIMRELHAILRSHVDPDAVTEKAFGEQERRLSELVRGSSRQQFIDLMKSRLGKGQTMALARKYYS